MILRRYVKLIQIKSLIIYLPQVTKLCGSFGTVTTLYLHIAVNQMHETW